MSLSPTQIQQLAHLAKLHLTEEEQLAFSDQLTTILSYVDLLNEVDTTGVQPTVTVIEETMVTREDTGRDFPFCTTDELLQSSHLPKDMKQLRVPNVLD